MSINRDLELLYEIGSLRFLQRTWKQFLHHDFQNISEHMYRVAWIALVIAKHERCENLEKILKMALVHDLTESRVGDVNYLIRQYTERNEDKAAEDIFSGTSLGEEYEELLKEYETHSSIEAKIVKDADNIDADLELQEQEWKGSKLKQEWDRKKVYNQLYTKTAKKLWEEIQKSNPHDWHTKARNRFTDGDWKK